MWQWNQRSFSTDYLSAQLQVLLADRARQSSYCLPPPPLCECWKGLPQTPNTTTRRLQESTADRQPAPPDQPWQGLQTGLRNGSLDKSTKVKGIARPLN